jgi:phasin family protein
LLHCNNNPLLENHSMIKFGADFGKLFPAATPVDFKALLDIQQKNIDAVVAAGTKLAEGAQQVLKRQAELAHAALQEGTESFSVANLGKLDKQIEFVKASTEKSVANAREIADLAAKAGNEAIEILRKRAEASVGEFSTAVKTAA